MTIKIIYEDQDILVCVKPPKVPSQSDLSGDLDMRSLLSQNDLGLVHRLDRPVGGLMVFGKTKNATSNLSRQLQEKKIEKKYMAVVMGKPEASNVRLENYLYKNALKNVSKVVDKDKKNAKLAVLSFDVVQCIVSEDEGDLSLIKVTLLTGRHHQIRVQLAHVDLPIWGDSKYNLKNEKEGKWHQIALWSYELSLCHPRLKKKMIFKDLPEDIFPFTLFDVERLK